MERAHFFRILGLAGFLACFLLRPASASTPPAAAAGQGRPKIQFETNFYDFGKITASETIFGEFKFKNTGDGVLKVAPPEPSCDCTQPFVNPDTLAPGQSGEIVYSIKLDRALSGQRYIRVRSNDPDTPVLQLTMKLDYTPLYELSPRTLRLALPAGTDTARASFIVTRIDGRPLDIVRLSASIDWISAAVDPSFKPQDSSARIEVTVHRPVRPPSQIDASVQMWAAEPSARPAQSIKIEGEIQGELAASPSRLYWVIPDFGNERTNYPPEALTRKIELRSTLGCEVQLKNPASSISGLSVQVLPKEAGKTFDLLLKFDQLPKAFATGKVTVETSLASLPELEVPVSISVPGSK